MTYLGRSYMPVGLTSNPSERGTLEKGYLTREAHSIDMIRFMAWSAQNSTNHDVVVFNTQEHNYRMLHGMNLRNARKASAGFSLEKVDILKRLADENGINVNVYDTTEQLKSSSFQDSFADVKKIWYSDPVIKEKLLGLVPTWIQAKVNHDPKKVDELSIYAMLEVAYIIDRAGEVKVGHQMEQSYDSLTKYLVQEGFVKARTLPSFAYPFKSGMRITSDLPIEPYRVPDNPGARADRVLVTDSPKDVKTKLENALSQGKKESLKNYLEMILDTAAMISPKPGTTMDWLPDMAHQYLEKISEKTTPSSVINFPRAYSGAIALAASVAIIAGALPIFSSLQERSEKKSWMKSFISQMEQAYPLSNKDVSRYIGHGKSLEDLSLGELERAISLLATDDSKDEIKQMKNPDYAGLIKFRQEKKQI